MYVRMMYVCMYVRMYVCMYVYMYIHTYVYTYHPKQMYNYLTCSSSAVLAVKHLHLFKDRVKSGLSRYSPEVSTISPGRQMSN